ncbi:hypothetical protein COCON_G00028100 [Conger conger]|uniref:Ankyrin repeat domain-containing protein 61 n=1 Tax=Conger conger TaxID=82655 RepID=A0A9Q1DY36_CONCO|nr:hypothetical protein COCON_G00028100 [Conger conger]
MAANSDGELNQHSLNNALNDAILTGDALAIRNILKIRSADSPLHSPIGLLGNGHSQHRATLPIHLAAIYRKVESLEILLHSGADPERRDHRGCSALHLVITHWPKTGRTRSKPQGKFQTAIAAREQCAEACLRLLCRWGADVNARVGEESGDTAVHLAVHYGALPALGILASHGARVNATDSAGMRPLHMAAGTLSTDMAACLLRHGAEVRRALGPSGSTALHMAVTAAACEAGRGRPVDLSCVRELLAHGADPNAQDQAGRTPLHQACQDGQEETAVMLLEHGADVNIHTSLGENCLFLLLDRTANLERASLLERLLSLTYPLTITNGQGELPRALLLPQHRAQRDLFLELCKQPVSLQDTCRVHIHRHYGERARLKLRELMPEKLHSFVYSSWKCPVGISFPGTHQSVDNETPGDLPRTPGDVSTGETHASIG